MATFLLSTDLLMTRDLWLLAAGALILFMVCGPLLFRAFKQPNETEKVAAEN